MRPLVDCLEGTMGLCGSYEDAIRRLPGDH